MDRKLAGGFTRQGFRVENREYGSFFHSWMATLHPLQLGLTKKGKIPKARANGVIVQLLNSISQKPSTICVERMSAIGSVMSFVFDTAILSAQFVPEAWPFSLPIGHDENLRAVNLLAFRISNRLADIRWNEKFLLVREHAVRRYIERAGESYESLRGALWPGLLLLEPMRRQLVDKPISPIVLPASDGGLFLGFNLGIALPNEFRKVQRLTVGEHGSEDGDILPPVSWAGQIGSISFVSTYVADSDLSHEQRELRHLMVGIADSHNRAATRLLFESLVLAGGQYFNPFGFDDHCPSGSVDALLAQMASLQASRLWARAVWQPSETIFGQIIEAVKREASGE